MRYGSCPVIVPRVENTSKLLDAFEPIHGVLLAEGEDISPAFRPAEEEHKADVLDAIASAHPSDTSSDFEKDCIEFELVRRCLHRGIPYLGICRGSQILNVVAGGSVLLDIDTELRDSCKHIDYDNYDGHRHPIKVVPGTPLAKWFDDAEHLQVNSYHHQGIKDLASRFIPMAHSPDGLVEGFYDPSHCDIEQGKFFVGLQFHPERMQDTEQALQGVKYKFDHPGCPRVYEALVQAAAAFQQRTEVTSQSADSQRARVTPCERDRKLQSAENVTWDDRSTANAQTECLRGFNLEPNRIHSRTERKSRKSGRYAQYQRKLLLNPPDRLYEYSEDDLERLFRSGATVHGRRLAYNLLKEPNFDENRTPNKLVKPRKEYSENSLSNWDLFCRRLQQAEKYLLRLQDAGKRTEAISRVQKLSKVALVP